MKMPLPILLRCHPAAFLELPVKVGNVCDSDLVADLLGGEAGGGKQAFCGCHAFIHDVAAKRCSCLRTENVGQVIRVHVDFVGDGGAAQIRIGKMRTDIVLDDADRVRGIGGQVLFHIQPLFLIPCIFFSPPAQPPSAFP